MRSLQRVAAAGLVLFATGSAFASPPVLPLSPSPMRTLRTPSAAAESPAKPAPVLRVRFGDDDVEVSRARPFDDWVLLGGPARHASLVPLRANFHAELFKSAEDL
ncbi:MAG: hypothetical protein IT371_27590 [Deltaproteobacteria bacterium]|nr:hypothetical protein [Deltaproteobacteria bacterium]